MAKQVGDIKITGTFGDISFYKSGGQYLVRRKGGPSSKQVKTGAGFVRVRENYNEFGNCAKVGKQLRQSVKRWCGISDAGLYKRLTQLLMKVKNEDTQSVRGQRSVSKGLKSESGKALLRHFDFNNASQLSAVLLKPLRLTTYGTIEIMALNPGTDIVFAKGATEVRLKAVCVQSDLESGKIQIHAYDELLLKKEDTPRAILLKPKDMNTLLNSDEGELFYFVWLAFDNNSNGVNDVLCLVDVNKGLCVTGTLKKKLLKKPVKIYRDAGTQKHILVSKANIVLKKRKHLLRNTFGLI